MTASPRIECRRKKALRLRIILSILAGSIAWSAPRLARAENRTCQAVFGPSVTFVRQPWESAATERLLAEFRAQGLSLQTAVSEIGRQRGYRFEAPQLRSLLGVYSKLRSRLGTHLDVPSAITVTVYDYDVMARAAFEHSANGIFPSIHFGMQEGIDPKKIAPTLIDMARADLIGYDKPPSASNAAFAHEYGHVLFHYNLGNLGNPVQLSSTSKIAIMDEMSILKQRYPGLQRRGIDNVLADLDFLDALPADPTVSDVPEVVLATYQALERQLKDLDVALLISDKYLAGYSELFADVTTVIAMEDPRAMSQSLNYMHGRLAGRYDGISRSFERRVLRLTDEDFINPHNRLNVARHQLWERYFKRVHGTPKAGIFAKKLLEAMDLELRWMVEAGATTVSWEELNARLVDRFTSIAGDL